MKIKVRVNSKAQSMLYGINMPGWIPAWLDIHLLPLAGTMVCKREK